MSPDTLKELQLYPGDLGRWTNGDTKPKIMGFSLPYISPASAFSSHMGTQSTCHRVLI